MKKTTLVMGVDVGGTRTKLGFVDLQKGCLVSKRVIPTVYRSLGGFTAALAEAFQTLLADARVAPEDVGGMGIGVPGYVDGDYISQVWDFLAFMEGKHFRQAVESALHIPVRIENDARVVAIGEYFFGGHGYPSRMVSLTLGTGVGFGFVRNGSLHEATSIEHMAGHILIRPGAAACYCGFNGCLEALICSPHIVAEYAALQNPGKDNSSISAADVFAAYALGDAAAARVIDQMLLDLTSGLNVYIYQYAPELFVLGGGLSAGLESFSKQMTEGLFAKPYQDYRARVRFSKLGEEAGLLGAASLWMKPDQPA